MFPARLHDTRQTTSGNFPVEGAVVEVGAATADEGSSVVLTHGVFGLSFVQIITLLSCRPKSHIYEGKHQDKKRR